MLSILQRIQALTKPPECHTAACPLATLGESFSKWEGDGSVRLVAVTDAPGEAEVRDGFPLRPHAPAGSVFTKALERLQIPRDRIRIGSCIQCRPPKNLLEHMPYEGQAIRTCQDLHFAPEITRDRPHAFLAMGNVALRTLTGWTGKKRQVTNVRGFILESDRYPGIPVISTYHPSYLLRDKPNLIGVFRLDILNAYRLAQNGGRYTRPTFPSLQFPTMPDAERWLAELRLHPSEPIVYDIETKESMAGEESDVFALADGAVAVRPEDAEEREAAGEEVSETIKTTTRITQIQFCYDPARPSLVLPFEQPFIDIAKQVMALPNPKIGHNSWSFDNPLMRRAGMLLSGELHDSMYCLASRTRIPLWGGSETTIGEIVDRRLDIQLIGMDSNGNHIPVNIAAYHKTVCPNQTWIKIKSDSCRFPMYLTPEHRVWTDSGWKTADQIQMGDKIPTDRIGNASLIHGSLLGDGWIDDLGLLVILHSATQRSWLEHKARNLGMDVHEDNGRTHPTVHGSKSIGKSWRNRFYPGGVKQFIPPCDYAALAVWYCDDGSWKPLTRFSGRAATWNTSIVKNFIPGDGRVIMAIKEQFKPQLDEVVAWFKQEFGDEVVLLKQQNKGGRQLHIKKSSRDQFYNAIREYVPPSMYYKLPPRHRGFYNGWLEVRTTLWSQVESVGIDPEQRNGNTRYCVTVEHDTHRFFTKAGLVSNCWHHFQPDLPRGLQFVTSMYMHNVMPWKHLSQEDPGGYGVCDVAYPRAWWPTLRAQLEQRGLWDGYDRYVRQRNVVLEAAARRGLPIDNGKRLALRAEVQTARAAVDAEIQAMVPDSLKGVQPKAGYANPKIAAKRRALPGEGLEVGERWVEREFDVEVKPRKPKKAKKSLVRGRAPDPSAENDGQDNGQQGAIGSHDDRVASASQDGGSNEIESEAGGTPAPDVGQGNGGGIEEGAGGTPGGAEPVRIAREVRLCRLQPFLPNSSAQILRYIKWRRDAEIQERVARYIGSSQADLIPPAQMTALVQKAERTALYIVPRDLKDEKDTTAKKELERLGRKTGDPFFRKTIDYRELNKFEATFIEPWTPAADGCVHTTFKYTAATGQTSSTGPFIHNAPMPKGEDGTFKRLAKAFQGIMVAHPGKRWIEIDYRAFHVLTTGWNAADPLYMALARRDMHSFVAGHMLKMPDRDRWVQMALAGDPDLDKILKQIKTEHGPLRNRKAKPCIAEGQLVLTDKGLIPIENVQLAHRVWDGVEWVSHSGVVCQGYEEVITYDGLTATPDHEVFLASGSTDALWRAASRLERIERTGIGRSPIRTSHSYFTRTEANKGVSACPLQMSDLWEGTMDLQGQPTKGSDQWLSGVQSEEESPSGGVGQEVRCHRSPLQQASLPRIQVVRCERNSLQLREQGTVCSVGSNQLAISELRGSHHRSSGQQWPLRTGESATCHTEGANKQSKEYCSVEVVWETDCIGGVFESIRPIMDETIDKGWYDGRTDNCSCSGHSSESQEELSADQTESTKARVYDILNAGPRHRFTVSGVLVANCILGVGFGLGWKKLYDMNQESFASAAEAKGLLDLLKSLFPKVFKWQDSVRSQAHRQGFLRGHYPFIRWFHEVYRWDPKNRCMAPGRESEAAIAFHPSNDAFGIKDDTQLWLGDTICPETGLALDEKYGFVHDMHDSLWFHCPDQWAEEAIHVVAGKMKEPSPVLRSPLTPEGLWCDVEVTTGRSRDVMEEVRI